MTRKTTFFERWSWFKLNNLGLVPRRSLKFHTSVGNVWKLKFKKIWGVIPKFLEVTGEKLVGGFFLGMGLSGAGHEWGDRGVEKGLS